MYSEVISKLNEGHFILMYSILMWICIVSQSWWSHFTSCIALIISYILSYLSCLHN